MSFTKTFIDIINHINNEGNESQPRDLKVREVLLADFQIDPNFPIADFPDRKFNWKYLAGELAWYLHRDSNIDYINDYSKFWGGLTNPNTNEVNSNYGNLVINNEQFSWVIESLKSDPSSRQAIMFFNQPKFQFEGNKDFVCTMYSNFFIRNNTLMMKVQMRSNDIFYGLTFDAPFFSFLLQSVYHILLKDMPELKLGYYFHYADNLHFYERHFELAESMAKYEPETDYSLILKKPFIEYKNGVINLSDAALEFVSRIDSAKGSNEVDYKSILADYFTI
jgi:thymidylate synthase